MMIEKVRNIFSLVAGDQLSGSGTLARKLTEGLLSVLVSGEPLSAVSRQQLVEHTRNFSLQMSSFAVIRHFCSYLLEQLEEERIRTYRDLYHQVTAYQEEWARKEAAQVQFFLENFPLDGKTVITHSQSSTVQQVLFSCEDFHGIRVIQTESRPGLEGCRQAEKLAAAGVSVVLISDTAYTPLLKNADMVLFGADTVYSDFFINKCGTWAMTVLARRHNIPVYVIADPRKIYYEPAPSGCIKTGDRPGEEILETPLKGIEPMNHYFEVIPTREVTAFIIGSRIIPGQEMPLQSLGKR